MDTKMLSLFLVIVALFGLWLDQQHKLLPVLSEITTPASTGTSQFSGTSLGEFVLALTAYIFVLTLLSPKAGFMLTLLLALGALAANVDSSQGDKTKQVIPVLFGGSS